MSKHGWIASGISKMIPSLLTHQMLRYCIYVVSQEQVMTSPTLQNHLNQARVELHSFSACSQVFDDVNLLSLKLNLSEEELDRLRSLSRRWKKALALSTARYDRLFDQLFNLSSYRFNCDDWLLFVTQAQAKLTAPLSRSRDSLSDQAR